MNLENKKILLLVTGSIAIYKSLDLISSLKKLNAKIFVVMSDDAIKFINPLCFEAMSGNKVLHSNSQKFILNSPNHISYASLADIAIVAPASINTIAKLNYGIADTIILETLFASKCPILIAPSANINMLESPQTKANIKSLQKLGYTIIPPRVTLLACNITAKGAMASIEEIIFHIKRNFLQKSFWRNKSIIITGGGSIENIDDIRHISNNSSGKQASNLALALYFLGANVTLISSKFPITLPIEIKKIKVNSSSEFKNEMKKELKKDSILIMAAAISDYIPQKYHKGKLKKEYIGKSWKLDLIQNEDILKNLHCSFKVGFKAESDEETAKLKAKKMLESTKDGGKGCDMVILNIINKNNKIGDDSNKVTIYTKSKEIKINKEDKFNISIKIANFIEQNYSAK
ncbi:bifunctional phosphopantothenoylcysteine decarboxylase/phosphopantothenate--cysteine ligase CoaBC [Helicobacter sp. MIT 14-3879]|uniref:bifunctional phosphopantothenoylcysteine decarboxylase/phosphopantothenate--cysteine ligase CoaBC n=1 Tax=Helicobacter sp. MIT 14-3879 TaxID=2040649 RepID=UPI000E1E3164|nr:bifunctional phosphopantothenoylcysteine decarboxylase/phosphopantothenate--cysteine ligase CoaBC [Helicobacter sp. MIT 14-3879]RDU64694.1 bifunctional phosphopantothenoylcysteine decarboxylase/phosphopantothenate--cysteine ligase CoaBC [Helicobacter sp. MIT 14-3879]